MHQSIKCPELIIHQAHNHFALAGVLLPRMMNLVFEKSLLIVA